MSHCLRKRSFSSLSRSSTAAVVGIAATGFGLTSAQAATFTVTSTTDDAAGTTEGTLSWAIAQANSAAGADEIVFDSSVTGTLEVTAQPTISDELTITGPGSDVLTIDGDGEEGGPAAIFRVDESTLTISELTLTGDGDGSLVAFSSESSGSTLNINACVVTDVEMTTAINVQGDHQLDIRTSTFSENRQAVVAQGLSSANIENSSFRDHDSRPVYIGTYSEGTISGTTFSNNEEGALHVGVGSEITLTDSSFTEHSEGALFIENLSEGSISRCIFSDNSETSGRFENADITITDSTFNDNSYTSVRSEYSDITIAGSTFSDNSYTSVRSENSDITIAGSTFNDNSYTSIVARDSNIGISQSTFSNNEYAVLDLNNGVNVTVDSSVFSSNTSYYTGVINSRDSSESSGNIVTVTNSAFHENRVEGPNGRGAVLNGYSSGSLATLTFDNCTFTQNRSENKRWSLRNKETKLNAHSINGDWQYLRSDRRRHLR
jgi:hypothetical protein